MKKLVISFCFLIFALSTWAQFPPAAGQVGSTAIAADSSIFVAWANSCIVERGWQDIAQPDSGYVDFGAANFGIGIPDNSIVSLGDGGTAVLAFEAPIRNGDSWDFAIFENGFTGFLELAFVEVSDDGQNFYRFPATSLTDTLVPVGSFGAVDPIKINNLAGKYVAGFGTPFDLEELANIPDLDVNHITHIRLIDVVGSLDNTYATRDAQGYKINDPYPTLFASSGFDLDAVGVIHQDLPISTNDIDKIPIAFYPNPISSGQSFQLQLAQKKLVGLELYNSLGKKIRSWDNLNQERFELGTIAPGIYFIRVQLSGLDQLKKIIVF